MKIATADALRAADARALGPATLPAELSFSTDTRSLVPGDAFVALRGERFDGHDFLEAARAAGAALAVVDDARAVPPGFPAVVVRDTTRAYLAFAAEARLRSRARFVAITGSAGKTTTKAFLAQVLEHAAPGRVVATPRNENNEIGVAKLLLGVPGDARFVVVELGARHAGEIAPLALAARPETALLTNVGEAHLEVFGSRAQLAATKWGIFASGARRVLNVADETSRAFAERDGLPATWFGVSADAETPRGETALVLDGRDELRLRVPGHPERTFRTGTGIRFGGDHNLANAAAAAAAAFDLGLEPATIAAALGTLALPAGRYERSSVAGFDVIYDAYNANFSGMLAALSSFARENASRRIAVLGSMAELGDDAPAMHRTVGAAAAEAGLATLLVGGDYASELTRGALEAGMPADRIVAFADTPAAAAWLRQHARGGDLVLLKAARKYKFEELLAELRGVHAG